MPDMKWLPPSRWPSPITCSRSSGSKARLLIPQEVAGGDGKKVLSGTELRGVSCPPRHYGGSSDWFIVKREPVTWLFIQNEYPESRSSTSKTPEVQAIAAYFRKS